MACPIATPRNDIGILLQESFPKNDDEHSSFDISDPDNNVVDCLRKLFFECNEVPYNLSGNCLGKNLHSQWLS